MKLRRLTPLIFCTIILFTYYLLFTFFHVHIYIPCPFHFITGLYCSGCGLTRMVISLLKLDFYQAYRYNPFLFVSLPFDLILLIDYIYAVIVGKKSYIEKIPNWFWYVILTILLIYWILRNLIPYLEPTSI